MMDDSQFEHLINQAMDELPQEYIKNLKNVGVVVADLPSEEQRKKLRLHCNQTLFGLYEGIPQTSRGIGYNLVLPDKITIFKTPILEASPDERALKQNIKRTLWHEIAHHYGLNHDQIHKLENNVDTSEYNL
jgi:predicted Zn-dependent protease with MMP-like domain